MAQRKRERAIHNAASFICTGPDGHAIKILCVCVSNLIQVISFTLLCLVVGECVANRTANEQCSAHIARLVCFVL